MIYDKLYTSPLLQNADEDLEDEEEEEEVSEPKDDWDEDEETK